VSKQTLAEVSKEIRMASLQFLAELSSGPFGNVRLQIHAEILIQPAQKSNLRF
jgi:hypothetical protein